MLIRALLLSQWGQRTERTSSGGKIHIRTGKELVLQKRTQRREYPWCGIGGEADIGAVGWGVGGWMTG